LTATRSGRLFPGARGRTRASPEAGRPSLDAVSCPTSSTGDDLRHQQHRRSWLLPSPWSRQVPSPRARDATISHHQAKKQSPGPAARTGRDERRDLLWRPPGRRRRRSLPAVGLSTKASRHFFAERIATAPARFPGPSTAGGHSPEQRRAALPRPPDEALTKPDEDDRVR